VGTWRQHAVGGYVVTSGRFTQDAISFAEGRNIELIDGATLPTILRHHRNPQPTPATTMANTNIASPPACPRCNEPMAGRVAKRGASSGSEFWGCRRYPQCTATLAKISGGWPRDENREFP
jgi:restriction system protein